MIVLAAILNLTLGVTRGHAYFFAKKFENTLPIFNTMPNLNKARRRRK